jgi:hypothetical protein
MGEIDAGDRIGAPRLARRYREALGLADDGDAERLQCVSLDWLEAEALDRPEAGDGVSRWRAIDSHDEGGTFWLIDHELRPAASAYIRAHGAVLLAG